MKYEAVCMVQKDEMGDEDHALRLIERLKAGASPPGGICMKRIGVRNRCGINKRAYRVGSANSE